MSMMALVISIAILLIAFILGAKYNYREKMSPFECGFDQNMKARIPFSIQFFMITIIFLIFDIEFILLLPIMSMKNMSSSSSLHITTTILTWLLLVGLLHEWTLNSLNWTK